MKVSEEPRFKGNKLADPEEVRIPRSVKGLGTFSGKPEKSKWLMKKMELLEVWKNIYNWFRESQAYLNMFFRSKVFHSSFFKPTLTAGAPAASRRIDLKSP